MEDPITMINRISSILRGLPCGLLVLALTLWGMAGGSSVRADDPPACVAAPAGLVGFWPLDGSYDPAIGSVRPLQANIVTFGPGMAGSGAVFDGLSSQLRAEASPALNFSSSPGFSLETWFWSDQNIGQQPLFEWSDGGGLTGVHVWLSVSGPGSIFANFVDSTGNPHPVGTQLGIWEPSRFQHLVVTYDASGGWIAIYLNGAKLAEGSMGGLIPKTDLPYLVIGRRPGAGSFRGVLDEIAVYGRALLPAEVQTLYALGSTPRCRASSPGPWVRLVASDSSPFEDTTVSLTAQVAGGTGLAYRWSHNGTEISGQTNATLVLDKVVLGDSGEYRVEVSSSSASSASASATLNVQPAPVACFDPGADLVALFSFESSLNSGPLGDLSIDRGSCEFAAGFGGQGLRFNGANASFTVPLLPDMRMESVDGLTVSVWVKPEDINYEHPILSWSKGPFVSLSGVGDGDVTVNLVDTGSAPHLFNSPIRVVRPGLFQHLAVTYDRLLGEAVIYVNGQEKARQSLGSFVPALDSDFSVGARSGVRLFQGTLDDLCLYRRALSKAEIASVYAAAYKGTCPPSLLPPTIRVQPTGGNVSADFPYTFSIEPGGGRPWRVEWRHNGVVIPSAVGQKLQILHAKPSDEGDYQVIVSNSSGNVASETVHLAVDPGPTECTPTPAGFVFQSSMDEAPPLLAPGFLASAGGPEASVDGMVGKAMGFDGTSSYVKLLSDGSQDLGAGPGFTLEGWFKPDDAAASQAFFDFGGGSGVHVWCSVGAVGDLFVNVANQSGIVGVFGTGGNVVTSGEYQHIALTYDKTSGAAILYRGGVEVARARLGVITPTLNRPLLIGARTVDAGSQGHFKGSIDEVAVYDHGLSAEEIRLIVTARYYGKCPPPKVSPHFIKAPASATVTVGRGQAFFASVSGSPVITLQWLHNGVSIPGATNDSLILDRVAESDGGDYQLIAQNAAGRTDSPVAILTVTPPSDRCAYPDVGIISWIGFEGDLRAEGTGITAISSDPLHFVSGKLGLALHFQGGQPEVFLPKSPSLDVSAGSGFTVEGWYRPGDWGRPQPVFEWHDPATGAGPHLWIFGPQQLFVNMIDRAPAPHVLNVAIPSSKPGDWAHLAVSYDAPTGMTKVYFNGVQVAGQAFGKLELRTDRPLYFGRRPTPGGPDSFEGDMDEVTLYDHPLTSSQILEIFQAGADGKCPPTDILINIASQPADVGVLVGATAMFSIRLDPPVPATYQWQHDGVDIPGATGPTLVLSNVNPIQAGRYGVVVRGSKNTVVSESASLAVLNPTNWARRFELTTEFSEESNPNGPWSYGWKEKLNGLFTLDPFSFGKGTEDGGWSGFPGWYPVIHHNATTNIFYAEGRRAILPPGSVWMFPGVSAPYNYSIIRFTVPPGQAGAYDMGVSVEPYLSGTAAGDTEFAVLLNGVSLFRRSLPGGQGVGFGASVILGEGDHLDFAVGRGSDNDLRASGLKISAYFGWLNRSPVAQSAQFSGLEDSRIPVSLATIPPRAAAFSYRVGLPSHGLLFGVAPELTYVPFTDFTGQDRFSWTVIEGGRESAPGTVVVNVTPVNDAPVADTSASPRGPFFSLNGSNAPVVLDGSKSFDVDGDPLRFTSFLQDRFTPMATQAVARVNLPVGSIALALMADDGVLVDLDLLDLRVIRASDVVGSLRSAVLAADLPDGAGVVLLSALASMGSAFAAGLLPESRVALIDYLGAIPTGLPPGVEASLRAETGSLLGWLESSISSGHLEGVRCGTGDCFTLHLSGGPNLAGVLEESSDLRAWRPVRAVVFDAAGSGVVEDLPVSKPDAARFYRLKGL